MVKLIRWSCISKQETEKKKKTLKNIYPGILKSHTVLYLHILTINFPQMFCMSLTSSMRLVGRGKVSTKKNHLWCLFEDEAKILMRTPDFAESGTLQNERNKEKKRGPPSNSLH